MSGNLTESKRAPPALIPANKAAAGLAFYQRRWFHVPRDTCRCARSLLLCMTHQSVHMMTHQSVHLLPARGHVQPLRLLGHAGWTIGTCGRHLALGGAARCCASPSLCSRPLGGLPCAVPCQRRALWVCSLSAWTGVPWLTPGRDPSESTLVPMCLTPDNLHTPL